MAVAVARRTPVPPIDEVNELEDDDVDMEPAPAKVVKGKAKKDKREIRSLIEDVRSTPAKMTPVVRGPKRKSVDFGDASSDQFIEDDSSSQRYVCYLILSLATSMLLLVTFLPPNESRFHHPSPVYYHLRKEKDVKSTVVLLTRGYNYGPNRERQCPQLLSKWTPTSLQTTTVATRMKTIPRRQRCNQGSK